MPLRSDLALAALLALAAPRLAGADEGLGLTLQGWGGVSRYDVRGLQAGVADQGRDLLQSNVNVYGASVLLRLGGLDLGALYEGGLIRSRTDAAVITPLVGLSLPLGESLRLDLLGELGGHRISNVQFSGSVDVSQARTVWLPYLGARPTLSFHLPATHPSVVISLSPFARWDLLRRDATLTIPGATAETTAYRLGGTTFGVAVGAGLEL